jgi:hypothetical protein
MRRTKRFILSSFPKRKYSKHVVTLGLSLAKLYKPRMEKSTAKCREVLSTRVQIKCLTKPTGNENLRRAIDENWERFEKKEKRG